MAGESRTGQAFSAQSAAAECAPHKDVPLTVLESPAPPALDPQQALFLDIDGTLLEIAPRPELVRVPVHLPALLGRLAAQRGAALALISGRPLSQLDALFRPWHGAAAGLHGLERRRAEGSLDCLIDTASAGALDRLRPRLAALASPGSGLILEDKRGTLALHYRAAPWREAEIRAAADAFCREGASVLRLIQGKMVVEFQPRTVNKGLAIAAFLAERPFRGRPPVFVGDDITDEDGFAEIRRRDAIAVRVGPPCATAANYRLPCVEAVLAWLEKSGLPQHREG
jgi:trehalose 6-phosphate phosphatase